MRLLLLTFATFFQLGSFSACDFVFSSNMRVHEYEPSHQTNGDPSIATDSNGFIYVVWEGNFIQFARSIDHGATFEPYRFIPPVSGYTSDPDIAVDQNDTIYIVWTSYDVFLSKSSDCGVNFLPGYAIAPSDEFLQRFPQVTTDRNGTVYVVWQQTTNPSPPYNDDIYFAKSNDGGSTFSQPILVNGSEYRDDQQYYPQIVSDESGSNIFITWASAAIDLEGVFIARSIDGGNTFDTPTLLPWGSGYPPKVHNIAIDREGVIYIAFTNVHYPDEYFGDLLFSKSVDIGLTFLPPIVIAHHELTFHWGPNISITRDGCVYLGWLSTEFPQEHVSLNDIKFSASYDGGETFIPAMLVSDDPNTILKFEPSMTVDPQGNVYLVWPDDRDGDDSVIYFSKGTRITPQTPEMSGKSNVILVGLLSGLLITIPFRRKVKKCIGLFNIFRSFPSRIPPDRRRRERR